jgi:thiamine-monophosphate kinase
MKSPRTKSERAPAWVRFLGCSDQANKRHPGGSTKSTTKSRLAQPGVPGYLAPFVSNCTNLEASYPILKDMRLRQKRAAKQRIPGELALIERIRSRAKGTRTAGLVLGIGDDCAILRPAPGEAITVTTDLSVAGRHFLLDWHMPEVVGHRTLARGLSDLAAMGARPLATFLSLALPATLARPPRRGAAWVDRFLEGFLALAAAYRAPLAGGDLAEAPLAMADIIAVGAVPPGQALLRSGARAGDVLYVTGQLGGAAAGLAKLGQLAAKRGRRGTPPSIPSRLQADLAAHLYPQPRIAQGAWLRRHRASSAIDLSDGLSTDLAHLCAESGVAAEVDAASLPLHPAATLKQALHGGEDYELLFTAPSKLHIPQAIAGVPVSRIGRIAKRRSCEPAVMLKTGAGAVPLEARGWQHFS